MDPDVHIRLATDEDKPKILQLLDNVFDEQQHFGWVRNDNYWHWKYDSNIFGKTHIYIAEHDGNVVSSSALWSWKFYCRGEIISAYQPCDTVVNPDYQRKGIFHKINIKRIELAKDKGRQFLFNFPNSNSLPGNLKLGWNYLSKLEWIVKPLKPFNLLYNIKDKSKANPEDIQQGHQINTADCYSIANKNHSYDGIIKTYRSKDFFRWRYAEHPFFKYGMVTVEELKKSAGAIFMINRKNKIREMIVVDVFGSIQLTPKLFRNLTETGKQYDVHYLTIIYSRYLNMHSLWKQGFIKVRNKCMVVLPLDLTLESKVLNYANWSIIGAMHDSL
jgi:N-acetylglutamate synthase-like GNAT family acetyltransferase